MGYHQATLEEEVTLCNGQTSSSLTGRTSGLPLGQLIEDKGRWGGDLLLGECSGTNSFRYVLQHLNDTLFRILFPWHCGSPFRSHSNMASRGLRFYTQKGAVKTMIRRISNGITDQISGKPIEPYSCFISYSNQDDEFAQRLHADLQQKGVRCWFAPEDLKIGDKFRTRIDESIRVYDKLMVILSENSIRSPWVEEEVEAALEKERKQNKLALFPIRLDDAVMETERAWAGQPAPHAPHRRLPRLERSRPLPEVVRPVIARPQSVTPPQPGACHGRPAPIHRGPGRARARAGCPCHVS